MSPAAPADENTLDSPSVALNGSSNENRRFADLRGVRWRIDLGVLPSSSSSSSSSSYTDDLRRVTADSRRRYAGLRRRLLVDPNISKDGSASPDLHIDNPLSQNPDSMWGRFFRNAELERMVDQDLSRLYPEHGIYFQTTECQSMLRRILLIWCLKHPEYGYRQGMHELMAPLLYVLHADVEQLSQMQKLHEDHFIDKFDDFSFYENDVTYSFDFKKLSESPKLETGLQKSRNISSLDDLDPKLQDIILLSDAYGAEGELGVVLSEKFMEHDAYCMFDALMSGAGGEVAMADFFSPAPLGGSHTGLPPVIEASFALYHLLSVVDASLHSHLVELGVEPQYFALRWLRVLFGREFSLDNLLLLWDEIFACDNSKSDTRDDNYVSSFRVLTSPRGAYISAIAVSMMLHMRSSLLATENATSCLQRLLNFPANVSLKKLILKAKSLQALSLDSNNSIPLSMLAGSYDRNKPVVARGHSLSLDSMSPRTALNLMPESYWEEKWRNLHKEEELEQRSITAELPSRKKGWSEKVRQTLSRRGSAPSPSRLDSSKEEPKLSVRRSLLEDLSRQLGLEEDLEESRRNDASGQISPSEEDRGHYVDGTNKNNALTAEERKTPETPSPDYGSESDGSGSHRSSPDQRFDFSVSGQAIDEPGYPSPNHQVNQSEGSSVASNSSVEENDDEGNNDESFNTLVEDLPHPISDSPGNESFRSVLNEDPTQKKTDRQEYPDDVSSESGHIPSKSGQEHLDEGSKSGKHIETMAKAVAASKDRKPLSGKFQWLWKLGRNNNGEGTPERSVPEVTQASSHDTYKNATASPAISESNNSHVSSNGDAIDQRLAVTLKDLSKSMIEKIQVIESIIHKEHTRGDQSMSVVDKEGQVTAMEALEELRKISNQLRGIGGG